MRAPRFTVIFVLLTSFSWSQQYQYPFQNPALSVEERINNMVTQHKYFPDIDLATAGAIHAGINHFLDNYRAGRLLQDGEGEGVWIFEEGHYAGVQQ